MDRASNNRPILSNIPSVDELLRTNAARAIVDNIGHAHALDLARKVQAGMRQDIIGTSLADLSKGELVERACDQMLELSYQENAIRLRNVINCTGVVIHTNLGRAPLSIAARQAITDQAAAYCTLEYDLKTGRRGKRAPKCDTLIA